MNCHGKCHLKKQIKQHEEENSTEKNLNQKEFQLFIPCFDSLKKNNFILNHKHQINYSEPLHPIQYFFDIFHPPKCNISS